MNTKSNKTEAIEDELNPEYIFINTRTKLLVDIVSGKIDPKKLAKEQLEGRGLDMSGKWVVGFKFNP